MIYDIWKLTLWLSPSYSKYSVVIVFSNSIADDNTIGIIKDATFYIFYDV